MYLVNHRLLHDSWDDFMTAWKNTPPWLPIDLPDPSKSSLHGIVAALDPENALRYQRKGSQTFCNIFSWDVARAVGLDNAHWINQATNQEVLPGTKGAIETNANMQVRRLARLPQWRKVARADALGLAKDGHLVLLGWDSQSARPGHIAVLLPEGTIAQAGAENFVGGTIARGFGPLQPQFFASIARIWPADQSASKPVDSAK